MDKLYINGPAKLSGEVSISKAKNAYLPILSAVVLSENKIHLSKVPNLRDIRTMNKILESLGVKIEQNGDVTTYDAKGMTSVEATYDLVKTMRASIFILGPLLARFGRAKVSLPGGCAIGSRPIDIHLKNLEKLGAKITLNAGYVEASCSKLRGDKLVLSFPSVGATENLMMAGVLAEGETIIENAAREPEIIDLANFLSKMGAKIEGAGTSIIKVQGNESASSLQEVEYEAIGDRIEAATYLMAALITNSSIIIRDIAPALLDSVTVLLREMGAKIEVGDNHLVVHKGGLTGVKTITAPFPGFPTDAQAQLVALATQAKGSSIITEAIFENRFMHIPELSRMGAKIDLKGNSAIIEGNGLLNAAPVMCTDLRASAALVIAALAAKGRTEIQRVYHLDRGYENMDFKLQSLGVKIERINDHKV